MTAPDIVLVLGGVGGLITAIVTAIVSLRRVEVVRQDVKGVHKIVNQQRTDMLAYQKTLIDTLTAQGIHVPTDKSVLPKE